MLQGASSDLTVGRRGLGGRFQRRLGILLHTIEPVGVLAAHQHSLQMVVRLDLDAGEDEREADVVQLRLVEGAGHHEVRSFAHLGARELLDVAVRGCHLALAPALRLDQGTEVLRHEHGDLGVEDLGLLIDHLRLSLTRSGSDLVLLVGALHSLPRHTGTGTEDGVVGHSNFLTIRSQPI